jgi:hypothetical protein
LKKVSVLFLSVFIPVILSAAPTHYPEKYVAIFTDQGIGDTPLKLAIHEVMIQSHKSLDYNTARKYLYGKVDLKSDGPSYYVNDVYCNKKVTGPDVGPMKIPSTEKINCEQTWPQSLFGKESAIFQKGDLHHLFPTDNRANSTRGNHPFADVKNGKIVSNDCSISQTGSPTDFNSSLTHFEPPNEHKGNVARAIFYFAIRYNLTIDPIQDKYLREWNREDPVDAEEISRNDVIESIQGNRNPFIDYPEMVDRIKSFVKNSKSDVFQRPMNKMLESFTKQTVSI